MKRILIFLGLLLCYVLLAGQVYSDENPYFPHPNCQLVWSWVLSMEKRIPCRYCEKSLYPNGFNGQLLQFPCPHCQKINDVDANLPLRIWDNLRNSALRCRGKIVQFEEWQIKEDFEKFEKIFLPKVYS